MNSIPLGEIIRPVSSKRAGCESFPILSMTMRHGLVDQSTKFKKRVASEDTSHYKVVERGQLVVGFPIDEGVLSFQDAYDKAIVSPAYGVWSVFVDYVDRSYLERYLKSPIALSYYASRLRSTTARRRSLPQDVFLNLPVPLPSLQQQQTIAQILDKADTIRRKRRQSIDLMMQLPQSLFRSMFAKNKSDVVLLSDLIAPGDRINYGVVQPGDPVLGSEGVYLVRAGDLQNGRIDRLNLRMISDEVSRRHSRSVLKGNEILISCVGSIGEIAIASPSDRGSNIVRAIARVPIADGISTAYIAEYLRSEEVQSYFAKESRIVAQPTLNIKQISETRVRLPPAPQIRSFEDRLTKMHLASQHSIRGYKAAETMFASLQHRAFSGML